MKTLIIILLALFLYGCSASQRLPNAPDRATAEIDKAAQAK